MQILEADTSKSQFLMHCAVVFNTDINFIFIRQDSMVNSAKKNALKAGTARCVQRNADVFILLDAIISPANATAWQDTLEINVMYLVQPENTGSTAFRTATAKMVQTVTT